MKIVFINSCAYLGGAELWHLNTALALKDRGHQVLLMLRGGPLADRAHEAGLEVLTLPMAFDLDLFSFIKALLYFRHERPDLILLNDQRECRIIAPAAALAGIQVRVQRKGWPFLKGSWRDRLVYKYFITHLIANSEAIAKIFTEKSGLTSDRIKMLPNGMDLEHLRAGDGTAFRGELGLGDSDLLIGSAGRLVTQKGFDLLIAAMALLKKQGLEVKACIAGDGPEKDRLAGMAREIGVLDNVIMSGQVDDIPSFLAALDLFVFPSRMEGRANALAEAMAAGRPTIATDIPGSDELIVHEKTGLLVRPEDPEAIAQTIKRLIDDQALAERIGESAAKYAEDFLDQGRILDELEKYLAGLIA